MNLPNSLTTIRILLIPPLVGVLLGSDSPTRETFGFLVFAVAAATDYLDGYLARRRSQITAVGQLLDPIADKLLISAAFISLVELDLVPAWMVIVVVGREFAVTGLRSAAARRGLTIAASQLGKYKMAAQVACVGCLIVANRFPTIHFNPFPEYLTLYRLGQILLWIVVFLAVLSMIHYFRKFWSMVDTGDPVPSSTD
jgi:CDP-diacylglycerol--glycerol-3-phosphate 3-phosphatidyltransferase